MTTSKEQIKISYLITKHLKNPDILKMKLR